MPTRVLVTGASGVLGRSLLARPAAPNYAVRALSRRERPGAGGVVEWRRADLATGEGLDAAVEGVDVVVHAASSAARDTQRTDVEGTRALLAAARGAGVKHLVYVSIVGVDRVPIPYYAHKLAAEEVVRGGDVPWTIVRGTQFHDFMDVIFRQLTRFPVAVVPRGFLGQPVHVGEFADALWRAAAEGPAGRAPDVAGPEVLSYAEMLRAWKGARGIRKLTIPVPIPGQASAAIRGGALTAPDRKVGRVTWWEWVRARYAAGPA